MKNVDIEKLENLPFRQSMQKSTSERINRTIWCFRNEYRTMHAEHKFRVIAKAYMNKYLGKRFNDIFHLFIKRFGKKRAYLFKEEVSNFSHYRRIREHSIDENGIIIKNPEYQRYSRHSRNKMTIRFVNDSGTGYDRYDYSHIFSGPRDPKFLQIKGENKDYINKRKREYKQYLKSLTYVFKTDEELYEKINGYN